MTLKFPITVYDRSRGDDIGEVDGNKVRDGKYILTFGGGWFPLPNLFGDDYRAEFNNTVNSFGYVILIKDALYNPALRNITVNLELLSHPDGGMTTAVPLIAIVAGVGAIVGGILVVTMLSKVQHIFELPVFPLALGVAGIIALPPVIKAFKGRGP